MTLIDKIKAIFESVTPEVAQVFKDVKTDNGVILRIEGELVEGSVVSEVGTDGALTVLAAGDYVLEDGTKITLDDAGKIAALELAADVSAEEVVVEAAVDPAVEPAVAPAVEETPAEETGEEDKMAALEAKVAELEAAVQVIAEQCKSMLDANSPEAVMAVEEMKKENKSLKKAVKELSAEPAAPAINFSKIEKVEIAKSPKSETTLSRIMEIKEKHKN